MQRHAELVSASQIYTIIRDISYLHYLHTSFIIRSMKIFFRKPILVAVAFVFFVTAAQANSMVQAFIKSQENAKNQSEEQKKQAASLITFNRDIAVKDSGQKTFNEITAINLVREMKTGWNLGNTLDATGGKKDLESEISWGMPKTTKAMIDGLAASGIKTIRIPVSWSRHIIDRQYTIDPKWMARVKQIVDWAIENDMYVILNIHHDNYSKNDKMPAFSGFYPTDKNYDESLRFVSNVWAQIALAFNNGYDEHLVFESLNEPRLCGTGEEWWYDQSSALSREAMTNVNKLNQAILDTIRQSGGNNKKRIVACPSLQASPESAMAYTFKMPQDYDMSKKRLIVSVHMYSPYNFAMEAPGISKFTPDVEKEFKNTFKRLNDTFIINGYAVYIGEYGATNKNNLDERVKWFSSYIKNSQKYGIACILWDNGVWKVEGNDFSEHYGFYNREKQTWYFPEIINAINEGVK